MNSRLLKLIVIAAVAVWPLLAGCGGDEAHVHDDHEGHDHAVHDADEHAGHDQEEHDADEHAGHDHMDRQGYGEADERMISPESDDHSAHDHGEHGHGDEGVVHLSPQAIRLAGTGIEYVQTRKLIRSIELPGEIGFNEDRLAHVTPRYPGVAREVHGNIGQRVKKGDLLAVLESNESLTQYDIVAPISGRIIEKHLTVGEFASEDHGMFLIADLSTVWADCEVYAKDVAHVKQGAPVRISAVEGGRSVDAVLSYVAPVYREETRSALARAVLANNGEAWRPGTFIRATIPVEMDDSRVAVRRDAVQILDGEAVVFVPGEVEGEYEIVDIKTGMVGEEFVEVTSGLHQGDPYVATGAFELKAKVVTANIDPHAGHGH